MKEIVIAGSTRTPGGKYGGTLKRFSAPQLGAIVIKGVIKRSGRPESDQIRQGLPRSGEAFLKRPLQ